MAWRFNAPPGWPTPPAGWVPPPGWAPDPSWPAAPAGWPFWVEDPDGVLPTPGPAPMPTPTGAPPAPRGGGCGRALLLAVLILVLLGIGLAVVAALTWANRSEQSRDLTTEAPTGAVRVEHSCGSITLREGREGVVETSARIRYLWRVPTVTSTVVGDVVVVEVDCPLAAFGSSVDLVVEVPPDGAVEARTSAGSVTAEGLSSDLTLGTSAGSVTATDVRCSRVSAESSAGSVSLSWADTADPVAIAARSSAGSVTVTVPDLPDVSYAVDVGSSAGRTTVEVRTDPQAERTISARSSAGSVVVRYR